MKKSILSIGKALNSAEQKAIAGGTTIIGDGCLKEGNLCIVNGRHHCCTGLKCKGGINGSHWGLCEKA